MPKETSAAIGNLDHKLEEIQTLFEDCMASYQDPKRFLTYLHALIQALRNFTFGVQANKKTIGDFDAWYGPWQERMRNIPYMKWLSNVRTSVVHEDILAAQSSATINLIPDYGENWVTDQENYMSSTDELIARAEQLIKDVPSLTFGVVQIERKFLVELEGKAEEVLAVLGVCITVVHFLKHDLERFIKDGRVFEGDLPKVDTSGFPSKHRFVTYKLKDGSVLTETAQRIELDQKNIATVKARYGKIPKMDLKNPDGLKVAESVFETAKYVFGIDGFHLQMVYGRKSDGWSYAQIVQFRDRSEKLLYDSRLAQIVKNESIDGLIMVGEAWIIRDIKKGFDRLAAGKEIAGLRKKEEVLMVTYVDKTGVSKQWLAFIERDKSGKPTLGHEIVEDTPIEQVGFFRGAVKSWGLI